MKTFENVAALAAAVGEDLGVSGWRTVTQRDINCFAEATGDRQWIHVDPERAKDGPFGITVAHGYLTLALIPVLETEIYEVHNLKMAVNYGADKLRFLEPVPVDSRVRLRVEVTSAVDTQAGTRVGLKSTIEIEGKTKPACVVDAIGLMVPR